MLSCKQASILAAKKAFNALSFGETLKFKMHSKMCSACKSFQQDGALIDEAIEKIMKQKEGQNLRLTDTQRERILKALD